jgi:MFS family permease
MPEPDAAHPDSGSDRPAAGALGLRPDWWLVIASSLEYLAISISTQASNQLWLDRFGGDYAAQARVMGRLSSGAAVLGLFLRPLVAQSSDIFGRKPLLLLAYGLQTLLKGGIAAAPEQLRLPLLALSQYLLGFVTWESSMFTISAAIGDMLSEADPTRLGVMLARQQTMWQVVTIVGPL